MKKIKIQISSWLNGSVLFEYESVDNTISKTVHKAVEDSANLGYANLRSANLRSANLGSANLRSANLDSANLGYANLDSANLGSAKNADGAIALTRILPDGDIIGWKKCRDNKIVKLLIPRDAKRSHAFGRKCRAEYAEVLEITKGTRKLKNATSTYDSTFVYKVGGIIKPNQTFSEEWTDECASGIHFFITKLEAEKYNY